MYCQNCGQQLSENAKFCANCGTRVDTTEAITNTEVINNAEGIQDTNTTEATIEQNIENDMENHTENAEFNEATEIDPPVEENESRKKFNRVLSKIFSGSIISAAIGAILFLGIVLVSLIGWGKVYLFDGYDFTAALASISMIFMLLGFTISVASGILGIIGKYDFINKYKTKRNKIIGAILLVACIGFSIWGLIDYDDSQSSSTGSSGGSYSGGSYNNNYSSGLPKSSGLNVKVDRITTSGSYTYVYCTIKNVSSNYNLATRYRYVKVKAQFKNYSGQIVDTDWTYAVDSTWLEPGESKTFYFMVKNTNIKSATLSFID